MVDEGNDCRLSRVVDTAPSSPPRLIIFQFRKFVWSGPDMDGATHHMTRYLGQPRDDETRGNWVSELDDCTVSQPVIGQFQLFLLS